MEKLTPADMDACLEGTGLIENTNHPEWGEWLVTGKTEHDGSVWWTISGDRGSRTLHEGELRFWRRA